MKRCDHCENEATVFYRVTINGRTQEKHLCADCAALEDFPTGFETLRNTGDFFPLSPFFAQARPLISVVPKKPPQSQESPESPRRENTEETLSSPKPAKSLATLKAELKRALRAEDYLRAASLRDQIRALEGK